MRKFIIVLIPIFLLTYLSQAQLRIALVGGGHTSSVMENNDLPNWNELKSKYTSRTGAHFGFLADLQLGVNSKLYMQPGVIFYNKGRKFSNNYDTAVFNYSRIDADLFANYIEVPFNLVYKIPAGKKSKFFVGVGPYVSFFYNGRERTSTFMKDGKVVTNDNTDLPVGDAPGKYQTIDLGVNALVGLEFNRVFISANYSRGITDFYTATYDGNFKHQVIGGTVGIFIGKPVPVEGRIFDRDEDGIVDKADSCFDEPGPILTNGCPDVDADGIADRLDQCPNEPGLARYNGCPMKDADSDGVVDVEDKCPDVPGFVKYNGCPIPDFDKDGVNDEQDSCATVPGLVRYNGCPIPDRDKDRVNDEEDRCPDQPGIAANNGCPEIAKETIEKVQVAARKIQFEFAKAILLDDSKKVLDELVTLMKEHPEYLLDIDGHTSNDGTFEANMLLSENRAAAVKNYMMLKGIDGKRLFTKGYGPTKPLNEGKTEAEASLNRRVELRIRNN